jgi:hypothetical protein
MSPLGGQLLTITYAGKYDRGPADGSFVYRIAGDQAAPAAFQINSNDLTVNWPPRRGPTAPRTSMTPCWARSVYPRRWSTVTASST